MYKGAARAQQLNTRTGSEATRPSAKGFDLLGGGECPLSQLTPEEQRASLVAKWKILTASLAEAKRGKDKRRVIGLTREIVETQEAISAIRPKRRSSDEVVFHFIDVCRETMTKPQFNAIMDEANRRLRAAQTGAAPAHPGEEGR